MPRDCGRTRPIPSFSWFPIQRNLFTPPSPTMSIWCCYGRDTGCCSAAPTTIRAWNRNISRWHSRTRLTASSGWPTTRIWAFIKIRLSYLLTAAWDRVSPVWRATISLADSWLRKSWRILDVKMLPFCAKAPPSAMNRTSAKPALKTDALPADSIVKWK